jgi:membrane-associated phospholipid phosphatase
MPSSPRNLKWEAAAVRPVAPGWTVPSMHWNRRVSLPLTFMLLAAVCIPTIDEPLARLRPFTLLPEELEAFFGRIETFGHSVGVAFILLAIWFLDHGRRRCLPRLMACTWGAGLAANLVKMTVGRVRPFAWVDQLGNTLPRQFTGWLPLGMNVSHEQSFPSAHTATIVGLAIGLAALYPQGRVLFFTTAALVAIQRIVYGAHYASDVFFAAGLACLVVGGLFRVRAVNAKFVRFETPPTAEPVERLRTAA